VCIVDRRVKLGVACRRIAWAKFINAGQICTSPDYLVVHKSVKDGLLEGLCQSIRSFYGKDPRMSPDYCRIIKIKPI
jgi:aldehyde dehydrogenase (NAD+)